MPPTSQSFKISTVLTADDSAFIKTIKKDQAELDKLGKSDLGKVGSNIFGKIKDMGKDSGMAQFTSEITVGTTSLSALAGPAAVAMGAIVGVGSAAVSAGSELFSLAKDASEFGSKLYDVQQKTGLAAETLSAMDLAAVQSGTSLEDVGTSTAKFSKLLAEAAGGSKQAKAELKALGVTSNDLETALGQAYNKINSLPEGVQQMTAAQDAFGKSGANLLPFIKGMDGDLAGLKIRAKELGITLTDEDLKAADNFGDTLDLLGYQAKVTSAKFALEFAPVITKAMDDASGALAKNQDTVREWGKQTGNFLSGIREIAESEMSKTVFAIAKATIETTALYQGIQYIKKLGREAAAESPIENGAVAGAAKVGPISSYLTDRTAGTGKTKKGKDPLKAATEDAKRLSEQLEKTIAVDRNQFNALLGNTKAREADNLAIELQLKGYDKLIPAKYQHILALAKEKDSIGDTIEEFKKLSGEFTGATQKYDQFVKSQLAGIADARGESNVFKDALADLDENVFSVITKAQGFSNPIVSEFGKIETAVKSATTELKSFAGVKWTSSSLAEFARAHGATPLDGYVKNKKGHNSGSKHYSNEALDVRSKDRTVAQNVDFMLAAIRAGQRVIDERIKPPHQRKWGGANIHVEENDSTASYFDGARLKYDGRLAELRAADDARRNGGAKYFDETGRAAQNAGVKIAAAGSALSGFDVASQRATSILLIGQNQLASFSAKIKGDLDSLNGVEKTSLDSYREFVSNASASGVFLGKTAQDAAYNFNSSITEIAKSAKEGNTQAIADLAKVGLDAKTAIQDYDVSLEKTVSNIGQMTDKSARAALAQELFGDSFENVLSLINKAKGSYADFKKELNLASTQNERFIAIQIDGIKTEKEIAAATDDYIARQKEARDAVNDRLNAEESLNNEIRRAQGLPDQKRPGGITGLYKPETDNGIAPKMKVGVDDYWKYYGDAKNKAREDGGIFDPKTIGVQMDALKEFKATANDVFQGVASGLGSMVESWVLYGSSGPDALKKMTAQVLASAAAESATQAVVQTAYGFADLAIYDFDGAAKHFTSAGIFASVAATTGIAGRLIAGDSFKNDGAKQSASAGGSQDSQNSGSATQPQYNFVRQATPQNFFNPQRQQQALEQRITELSESVSKLSGMIEPARPGDVMIRATKQVGSSYFAEQTINGLTKNSTQTGKMNRVLGNT